MLRPLQKQMTLVWSCSLRNLIDWSPMCCNSTYSFLASCCHPSHEHSGVVVSSMLTCECACHLLDLALIIMWEAFKADWSSSIHFLHIWRLYGPLTTIALIVTFTPVEQVLAPTEILRKASQVFGGSGPVSLDEQGRKRSEAALRNLQTYADSGGVGLKMLSKMGFGAAGSGLGRNEQASSQHPLLFAACLLLMSSAGMGLDVRYMQIVQAEYVPDYKHTLATRIH